MTNKKAWKPEDDDDYYFIDSDGEVVCDDWYIEEELEDRYSLGNCFKTKEEAEFMVEKLKVIAELKRFAEENNEWEIDSTSNQEVKYCIAYNPIDKCAIWYSPFLIKTNEVYFTSIKTTKEAIEKIGEERLLKYYFEVKQ